MLAAGTSDTLLQGQLRYTSPCLKLNGRACSSQRIKAFGQGGIRAKAVGRNGSVLVSASSAAQQEEESGNFGGAVCTLVLGSVLLGERLNGVGLVHALELHNDMMHPILLATVAGLVAAAVWPEQGSGSSIVRRVMSRVPYLGLAVTIIAEMMTGKGALALLDIETGVEALSDVEGVVAFLTMLVLTGQGKKKE